MTVIATGSFNFQWGFPGGGGVFSGTPPTLRFQDYHPSILPPLSPKHTRSGPDYIIFILFFTHTSKAS